jgi:hypothetical protein
LVIDAGMVAAKGARTYNRDVNRAISQVTSPDLRGK